MRYGTKWGGKGAFIREAIQTGLELDDASTGLASMECGAEPLTIPFAIVEKQIVEKLDMPGCRFDKTEGAL